MLQPLTVGLGIEHNSRPTPAVAQLAAMEENVRHVDDRATGRIFRTTETYECDAPNPAVRIRPEHARNRKNRQMWLRDGLISFVMAEQDSTNQRIHGCAFVRVPPQEARDFATDIIEEVPDRSDDLAKEPRIP